MHRLSRISVLLVFILALGIPLKVKSQNLEKSKNDPLVQNRMVVFESFLRNT